MLGRTRDPKPKHQQSDPGHVYASLSFSLFVELGTSALLNIAVASMAAAGGTRAPRSLLSALIRTGTQWMAYRLAYLLSSAQVHC